MDAALGLEPAVGVGADHFHRDRLDPGLLARALLDPLELVPVRFRPAAVHPQQHLGPVLGLGPAGAGVNLEEAVVAVGLAREQALELQAREPLAQRAERGLGLGPSLGVALLLGDLGQRHAVVERLLQAALALDRIGQAGALAHHLLRALGLVPECSGSRLRRSARRAGAAPRPSQRCLLSRASPCSICSAKWLISARMEPPALPSRMAVALASSTIQRRRQRPWTAPSRADSVGRDREQRETAARSDRRLAAADRERSVEPAGLGCAAAAAGQARRCPVRRRADAGGRAARRAGAVGSVPGR